jgi:phosphatidylinositol kinase/protein kinase (PI-3  family)
LYSFLYIDLMFATGLTPTLTEALTSLAEHVPSLFPIIQEKLLNTLCLELAGKPFLYPGMKKASFVDVAVTSNTPTKLNAVRTS